MTMAKTFAAFVLLLLAGCSGMPRQPAGTSACDAGEATYACQVERYHNVNVD
jgi:hypothetical protein